MADELQAVLSVDKKSLTVSRKDGSVMPDTIASSITSYNAKAGVAAYQALKAAADVVETIDTAFAETLRTQALVYFTPQVSPVDTKL